MFILEESHLAINRLNLPNALAILGVEHLIFSVSGPAAHQASHSDGAQWFKRVSCGVWKLSFLFIVYF